MTLLDKLRAENIHLNAVCGGNGICGKCTVKVKYKNETRYRLACETLYENGMEIISDTSNDEKDCTILHYYKTSMPVICNRSEIGHGIAIDIGTTTIAFELVAMKTGKRIASHTMVNSQRKYAADVLSRIKLASEDQQKILHQCIINDIGNGINTLAEKYDIKKIKHMAITGNTTMLHILLNLPCDSLGQFPFTPVSVAPEHRSYFEIFNSSLLDCDVYILPGVSAFVGADVIAGVYLCNAKSDELHLFIDVGTNGEMVLFSRSGIWATSTAAGPAFEAGNILYGIAAVPGAIAAVKISDTHQVISETIAGLPPIGLCGTGVMDLTAELIRNGIIDTTGLLDKQYLKNGFPVTDIISFTQKDIREIQLAKSAVRSGIEILLKAAGYEYAAIDTVFLAGGFGHKMNIGSAKTLGIIPMELEKKITAVGNAALGGCVLALLCVDAEADMVSIAHKTIEINLSAHPKFNEYFMDYMMF